jgi:hypothetical protein
MLSHHKRVDQRFQFEDEEEGGDYYEKMPP